MELMEMRHRFFAPKCLPQQASIITKTVRAIVLYLLARLTFPSQSLIYPYYSAEVVRSSPDNLRWAT